MSVSKEITEITLETGIAWNKVEFDLNGDLLDFEHRLCGHEIGLR